MVTERRLIRKPRPVNLQLFTIRFPVTAITSILHRISGVVLFLFLPFLLWVFARSLTSPDSFAAIQDTLTSPVSKFFIWIFFTGFIYHLLAGIRHLVQDVGYGESLAAGRKSSWLIIVLTAVIAVIVGVWLW